MVVFQVNALFFDQLRDAKMKERYRLRGYTRTVLLLFHNYVEIVLWFAAMYILLSAEFNLGLVDVSVRHVALRASLTTTSSFGQLAPVSATPTASSLILVQSLIGLFMTIGVLARFIALLPRPASLDPLEQTGPEHW
jgi:hypothetical protein